jgi:hypothetical protein
MKKKLKINYHVKKNKLQKSIKNGVMGPKIWREGAPWRLGRGDLGG